MNKPHMTPDESARIDAACERAAWLSATGMFDCYGYVADEILHAIAPALRAYRASGTVLTPLAAQTWTEALTCENTLPVTDELLRLSVRAYARSGQGALSSKWEALNEAAASYAGTGFYMAQAWRSNANMFDRELAAIARMTDADRDFSFTMISAANGVRKLRHETFAIAHTVEQWMIHCGAETVVKIIARMGYENPDDLHDMLKAASGYANQPPVSLLRENRGMYTWP
jgi:hypothetical protein